MHSSENRRLNQLLIATLVGVLTLLAVFSIKQWAGFAGGVQIAHAYVPAITITPSSRSVNVVAGETGVLSHTIENTGDQTGTFTITTSTTQSTYFTVQFVSETNPFVEELAPGEELDVDIGYVISGAAPNNTFGAVRLDVVLTSDPSIVSIATNTLTVVNPTATPTPTRTPTPEANIYADALEPNNTIQDASTLLVDSGQKCSLTLWPVGDLDYFRFSAKTGSVYQITTANLSAGLDTYMTVYDANFNVVGTNDDYQETGGSSQFTVTPGLDGFYFVQISNLSPTNPASQTYCIEVEQVIPTATPTPELLPTDPYEDNGNFSIAALIATNTTYSANFVPPIPPGPDNDFYQLWIKPGIYYNCQTFELSGVTDTNMILYDQNYNGLAGNDDKAPGDLGSEVDYFSTYTGWLFVLVGNYTTPPYDESPQFTYKLMCTADASTPTPTPTATPTPRPPTTGGGGGSVPPTATLIPSPTPEKPGTPVSEIPTATPRPVIIFEPLPTPTSAASGAQFAMLNVTVYYDENENFQVEQSEGIVNVQVSLYDSITGEWLAFGYTNEAGVVPFGPFEVSGPILVTVPYLGFSQIVAADSGSLQVRIAPQTLPSGIP